MSKFDSYAILSDGYGGIGEILDGTNTAPYGHSYCLEGKAGCADYFDWYAMILANISTVPPATARYLKHDVEVMAATFAEKGN